jgi:hypothetical protein
VSLAEGGGGFEGGGGGESVTSSLFLEAPLRARLMKDILREERVSARNMRWRGVLIDFADVDAEEVEMAEVVIVGSDVRNCLTS